jgi:hypothetical protein
VPVRKPKRKSICSVAVATTCYDLARRGKALSIGLTRGRTGDTWDYRPASRPVVRCKLTFGERRPRAFIFVPSFVPHRI